MNAIVTDHDYTLSDKFLTVELFFLLEEKKLIKGYKEEYMQLRSDYMDGDVGYDKFVSTDMDLLKKYIKGIQYLDLVRVIREDFEVEANMFDWSKEIRNIFNEDEWIFVVVSSTMDLCLEKMQDILNFDTYFCSSYEVKEGVFTGNFRCQVKSKEKGNYVRQLSQNLDKIVVVGDAPGDFEMMKYASSSYLFEPNKHSLEELKKTNLDCEIVDRNNILDKLRQKV